MFCAEWKQNCFVIHVRSNLSKVIYRWSSESSGLKYWPTIVKVIAEMSCWTRLTGSLFEKMEKFLQMDIHEQGRYIYCLYVENQQRNINWKKITFKLLQKQKYKTWIAHEVWVAQWFEIWIDFPEECWCTDHSCSWQRFAFVSGRRKSSTSIVNIEI